MRLGSGRAGQAWLSLDGGVAATLLVVAFFFGGSQRMDVTGPMLVRLTALGVIAVACVRMTPQRWVVARRPTLLALAFAGVPALQLIPLPPALWAALPGHGLYAHMLDSIALGNVWRPISLSPDRTLNSMLACLPMIAGALSFAAVPREQRGTLIGALLVLAAIGAVLSALQAVTGTGYFYVIAQASPSGTFANRNHWAMYLACCFPLLVAWVCAADARSRQGRWIVSGIAAAAILPQLLVAGSRAGLVLGAAALLASALIAWPVLRRAPFLHSKQRQLFLVTALLAAAGACAAFVMLGRGVALTRILDTGETVDLRFANLSAVWEMLRTFFPIGAGFGVFDPVFRVFESDAVLAPSYYNHAHSDPLELVIEAGAIGVLIVLAAPVIVGRTAALLWRETSDRAVQVQARALIVPAVVLMAGSLLDYPLRTPFLATFFILCAVWTDQDARSLSSQRGVGTSAKVR